MRMGLQQKSAAFGENINQRTVFALEQRAVRRYGNKKRKLPKIRLSAWHYFFYKKSFGRGKKHKKTMKTRENRTKNTQNLAKNVVFCEKKRFQSENEIARVDEMKAEMETEMGCFALYLAFFLFFCFFCFLLFFCLSIGGFSCLWRRVCFFFLVLCEPMSACCVLFLRMSFARCFCGGALRASFFEEIIFFVIFLMKKALLRLI